MTGISHAINAIKIDGFHALVGLILASFIMIEVSSENVVGLL